jgi:hypothetical protein
MDPFVLKKVMSGLETIQSTIMKISNMQGKNYTVRSEFLSSFGPTPITVYKRIQVDHATQYISI